jgi:hypothetical protein
MDCRGFIDTDLELDKLLFDKLASWFLDKLDRNVFDEPGMFLRVYPSLYRVT